MIIPNEFNIRGFTRLDRGEEGAVFIRYGDPQGDVHVPELHETPMMYGGKGTRNFTLSFPMEKPREVIACAIVERTSKNHYSAACFEPVRIETFRADTLGGLLRLVDQFFMNISGGYNG